MCARGGCGSFDDALAGALRSFAAVHGPLFGFAGLSDEKPEIREPIADWKAAQRVMESALKAEVFSRGGELDSSAIDERFKVTLVPGDEANRWSYVFDPGVVPSDLYRTCLKSSSVENYSTEDGSILRSAAGGHLPVIPDWDFCIGEGSDIRLLRTIGYPHSLGLLYSAFTYFCGFRVNYGDYKLMGLAPYGEPVYADLIRSKLIDIKDDGSFRLDLDYFDYQYGRAMTNDAFAALFGGPRRAPEDTITKREMDIAASAQNDSVVIDFTPEFRSVCCSLSCLYFIKSHALV